MGRGRRFLEGDSPGSLSVDVAPGFDLFGRSLPVAAPTSMVWIVAIQMPLSCLIIA
jgi:hypothetical protein